MLRSLILSVIWFYCTVIFTSFEVLTQIIDKYGFPVAVSIFIFIYFTRQINKKDANAEQYRKEMLDFQAAQSGYLRSLVDRRFNFKCEYVAKPIRDTDSKLS